MVDGAVVVEDVGGGAMGVGGGYWYGPPDGVGCTGLGVPGSIPAVVGGVRASRAAAAFGVTMGAGAENGVAGTPRSAADMNSCQVMAGHVPPYTWYTVCP